MDFFYTAVVPRRDTHGAGQILGDFLFRPLFNFRRLFGATESRLLSKSRLLLKVVKILATFSD